MIPNQSLYSGRNNFTTGLFMAVFCMSFSYYGVMVLLASFFKKGLLISESQTIRYISTYLTLVNVFIFFGSIFAERYLGIRRTFLLGHILYGLAFFMLTYVSFHIHSPYLVQYIMVLLILLSLAGTTMNSSPQVLMTRGYTHLNTPISIDLSYFYHHLFGSLGTLLGKMLFPMLIGTSLGLLIGYRIAFTTAGVCTFLGVCVILIFYQRLSLGANVHDLNKRGGQFFIGVGIYFCFLFLMNAVAFQMSLVWLRNISVVLFFSALIYLIFLILKCKDKNQKKNLAVGCLLCIQLMIFFIYRNQIFMSLSLYPINTMRTVHMFGVSIGGEFAIAFNALWNIIFTPILVVLIKRFPSWVRNENSGYYFVSSLLLISIAYGIFWYSCIYGIHVQADKISIIWFLFGHIFIAIAEIIVFNLVFSKISQLAPSGMTSTLLGFYFMSMSMGAIFAGNFSQKVALSPDIHYSSVQLFQLYEPFFKNLTLIALISSGLFLITAYWIRLWLKNKD